MLIMLVNIEVLIMLVSTPLMLSMLAKHNADNADSGKINADNVTVGLSYV